MKLEPLQTSLPQMGAEAAKRDKTLEKIGAAVEMGMEDAASRSIATMLQNDLSTYSQGLMNANDAISMMQIAGGALNSLGEQAQTLNDLSVRYNSASLDASQKGMLRTEFSRTVDAMQQTVQTASYNGQMLFGTNPAFSIGESTVSAPIPNVNPSNLAIESQESIESYRDSLNRAYSDVGSATNGLVNTANTLLEQITATAAAKSQLADTDTANAIKEFQQSNRQLDMAQIVMAHRNDMLQQNIVRLLG